MSIEHFKVLDPPDREVLKDIFSRQREREKSSAAKSPVVLLALNLVGEGGDGLRESTKHLNPSNMASGLTPRDVISMPAHIREEISNSLGAIACGMAICSIDDTISSRVFSYEFAASIFNLNISGTPFVPLSVGEIKEEGILDDKYKAMIYLAASDKTLTLFFEEKNLHLMPNGLRSLMYNMGILDVIRIKIIPIFKPRAELVISP